MALHFHRAVEQIAIWSASSDDGFSFVISYGSRDGVGLQGRDGYMASWRPLNQNKPAIRITGSPFRTLVEAEEACNNSLELLRSVNTA
jgi:hypothetical protein